LPADADDDPGGPGKKLDPTRAAMPGVVPVQVIPAIRTAFEPEGSAAKREPRQALFEVSGSARLAFAAGGSVLLRKGR